MVNYRTGANNNPAKNDSSCPSRSNITTKRNSRDQAESPNSDPSNTQHERFRTKGFLSRGKVTPIANGTRSISRYPVMRSVFSSSKVAKEAFKSLVPVLKFPWIRCWRHNSPITNTWICLKGACDSTLIYSCICCTRSSIAQTDEEGRPTRDDRRGVWAASFSSMFSALWHGYGVSC